MRITEAHFVKSAPSIDQCPKPDKPEYAFIGRSNVGKSSLINMLTGRRALAKTSGKPGKTQLINHFIINESWYLVDLPGYGYASVSKTERAKWQKMIDGYLKKRENLMCTFVLIDSRIEPQALDLEFLEMMGANGLPFVIAFTKSDKLKTNQLQSNISQFNTRMLQDWEDLPQQFVTSSEKGTGQADLLEFIESTNALYSA